MKNYLLRICFLAVSVVLLGGCAEKDSRNPVIANEDKIEELSPSVILSLTDEQATPEQLILMKKLERIFIYHTVANGNRMELDVDSQFFRDNGIPVEYYDLMKAQYDSNNEFADNLLKQAESQGAKFDYDLADMLKQNRNDYEAYLEEVGSDSITYKEYCRRRFDSSVVNSIK